MKILLSNKFYYRRGGDCIYMLNLEQLLKAHGHEVAVFAMDSPEFADDRRRLEFFDRLLEAWRRENEQGGNGLFTKRTL